MKKAAQANPPLAGVNFDMVFNRNERRVINALKAVVEREGIPFSEKDIKDAYAIAMNRIPAHYVQKGTIVLHANVSREYIVEIVRESLTQVLHITKS